MCVMNNYVYDSMYVWIFTLIVLLHWLWLPKHVRLDTLSSHVTRWFDLVVLCIFNHYFKCKYKYDEGKYGPDNKIRFFSITCLLINTDYKQ